MSWLKQRIHPLQLRYVAGCLCLVPGSWRRRGCLLAAHLVHRIRVETGQVARLESESPAAPGKQPSPLKPQEDTGQAEARR